MISSTIVHKAAGKTIPEDMVKALLEKNKSAFGYAIQDEGSLAIEGFDGRNMPTVEQFMELQSKVEPNCHAVFFFHDDPDPTGPNLDDIQPFPLTLNGEDGEQQHILASFMEGDFPRDYPVNEHGDAFNLFNDVVGPTLSELAELTDCDLSKIMPKLDSPLKKNIFLNNVSHRGHFVFLPAEGDPLKFGKDNNATAIDKSFDWGWVSNTVDLIQEKKASVPEVKSEVSSPKKSKFTMGKKTTAEHSIPVKEPEEQKPVHTKEEIQTPPSSTAVKVGMKSLTVPTNLNNKNLKRWFTSHLGQLPTNWRSLKTIDVPDTLGGDAKPKEPIKSFSEIKKEDVKTVPAKSTVREKFEPSNYLDGKERTAAFDYITKHMGYTSENMPKPEDIQKVEAKMETFTQCMGIAPSELFNWTVADIMGLAKEHPKASGMLIVQLRRLWMTALQNTPKKPSVVPDPVVEEKKEEAVTQSAPSGKQKFSVFGKRAAG